MSLVLRGLFNPAIYQPSWLASQNLLPMKEVEATQIEIIHPKVAAFSTDWLGVRIIDNRFQVLTEQASEFERLRDLVSGIFQILAHTPISALGVNQSFHFRLPSKETWHKVGHRLAPKEEWNKILSNPGMRSLTIEEARQDGRKGYLRVQVQPSSRITFGVFVDINDHYQLEEGEPKPGTDEVLAILAKDYNNSIKRGVSIAEHVVRMGEIP